MKVKFIWPHSVTYSTGPISGPVETDDVREVTEEEAEVLVGSMFWDFPDDKERATFLRWRDARDKKAREVEERGDASKPKQAIAKAEVKKEVQRQDQP